MSSRKISTLVAICSALGVGCASSYTPREPGRIHFVRTAGGRVLEKDGKRYGMSGLASDPILAVSGNPAAEEHARTFVSRTQTSGIVFLLGVAVAVPGLALNTTEPGHMDRKIAARGSAGAGMAAAMGALIAIVLSRHHLYDAVNIYNDGIER
jgi:hypothetical protein